MPKNIYKCTNCSEFYIFLEEEDSYFGLLKEKLCTDDSKMNYEKEFLRCPFCYEVVESNKALYDSIGSQIIVKKYKDGDYSKADEKTRLRNTIKAKPFELNIMEYYDLLSKYNLSKEQELRIRVAILILENNKRRDNKEYLKHPITYTTRELDNIQKLEQLLDLENGNFLFIEIKRYLGKFEEAMKQLELLYKLMGYRSRYFEDKFNKVKQLIEQKNIYVENFILSDKTRKYLKRIMY